MTGQRTRVDDVELRPVLICQSCCFAWEPLGEHWTVADVRAVAGGCPECGDWLYMGRIAHPDSTPNLRSVRP